MQVNRKVKHPKRKKKFNLLTSLGLLLLDLVSYRGPRSMVRVDMSVDTRSTHGRYLGRCIHRVSGECRSSIGRYIGDVSTDHWITFGREIDRQSVVIASPECRQFIGEPSVKYRSMHRPILGRHEKGTRILLCFKPVKPGHYSVIR